MDAFCVLGRLLLDGRGGHPKDKDALSISRERSGKQV